MTEDEVKEQIANGTQAWELLEGKFPTINRRLKSRIDGLNKIIEEVRLEFPDAQFYIDESSLTLLLGKDHADGHRGTAQQELTGSDSFEIEYIGVGGW